MTAAEAIRRAAVGELYELPPFTMPASTARHIVRQARRELDDEPGGLPMDERLREMSLRLLEIQDREVQRVIDAAVDGRVKSNEVKRLLRLQRQLNRLFREHLTLPSRLPARAVRDLAELAEAPDVVLPELVL